MPKLLVPNIDCPIINLSRIVYFIVAKETWYTGSKTERILEVVHQARKLIGLFLKMLDILLFSDWSFCWPMSKAPIKQKGKEIIGASDYDVIGLQLLWVILYDNWSDKA